LVAQVRTAAGREAQPSLAIIDSQSVRWGKRGDEQALMATAGSGRKRHIVVDVMGLVWLLASVPPMLQISKLFCGAGVGARNAMNALPKF